MLAFNAGVSDEPLKGSPKFIRTVALDVTQESEFGPHGKLIESRTFRPDGSLSYRHTYQYSGDEIQTTVFDGTGSEISRTERTGEDMQPFQLDQDGRASIPFEQMTVEARQDGDRTTFVMYGNDGAMLSQVETIRTDNIATCLITLPFQLLKTERIDERDIVGNWISKTLFESSDPTDIGPVVSTVERTITYFEGGE